MATQEKYLKFNVSIEDFMKRFLNEQAVIDYLIQYFYPHGEIVCHRCGCTKFVYRNHKEIKKAVCRNCKTTINILSSTIFEQTLYPLRTWMFTMYRMLTSKKGVATLHLVRDLDTDEKSTRLLQRRIRLAMSNYDLPGFEGECQIDETYIGGKNHGYIDKSEGKNTKITEEKKRIAKKKYPVLGIYNKDTKQVYSYIAEKNEEGKRLTKEQLKSFIHSTCKSGSLIVTDDFKSYKFLNKKDSGYIHSFVNHSEREWINEENLGTGGIESYWSILKKCYYGVHQGSLKEEWMHLYLANSDFIYNHPYFEEALSTLLKQSVLFPRVIDVRYMGKFGNKTYKLSDYRMVIPKCLDDKFENIKDITINDIINCEEPVYGIIRNPITKAKVPNWRDEYAKLGCVKGGCGYKDYRKNIINTQQDLLNMLDDAIRYKDANVKCQSSNKFYNLEKDMIRHHRYRLRNRVENLSPTVRAVIKTEYPRCTTKDLSKEKRREIYNRIAYLEKIFNKDSGYIVQIKMTDEMKQHMNLFGKNNKSKIKHEIKI